MNKGRVAPCQERTNAARNEEQSRGQCGLREHSPEKLRIPIAKELNQARGILLLSLVQQIVTASKQIIEIGRQAQTCGILGNGGKVRGDLPV